jgi:hypothetical protein
MTRYTIKFMRFRCSTCGEEVLVQPIKSINALVEGLLSPTEEEVNELGFCRNCGDRSEITPALFLGWIDENTPADQKVVGKYAVPAFLKK